MCKKLIYLMSAIVMTFGMFVTANAGVAFVGGDTTTQSNWRTAAALELDLEYGTDGYVIYGLKVDDGVYTDYDASSVYAASDNLVSLPAYIDDVSLAGATFMWSGNGNFGQIEDPANGNALTNTSLLANGDLDPWVFTITRTTTTAFRLTVMLSNGDNAPSNWITTVDDGGSASHDFTVPDTSNATYYEVFDVPSGSGAVTVTVEYIPGGSQFNVTGFAFDSASELASNPIPGDREPDVPRDVVLNWTPGKFAASTNGHNVYFGTNLDDVNDATGAVAHDANSYIPPQGLDFGTTYYWRVDEVNSAPDFTVFKGDVWRFTAEPYSIPIDAVTATASGAHTVDMGPEKTIDGSGLDDLDQHGTTDTDMWLTHASDTEHWIQYAFDRPQKLHQMWVWNSNQAIESIIGFGAKNVTIETSMDGTTWTALADVPEFAQASGLLDYTHNTVVDFGGVSAQYVKLTINAGWGTLTKQYGLSEVRFFAIPVYARLPQPADGASDLAPEVVLSWRAGRDAAAHEVYLGTDPNALTLAGQTSETRYTVSVALDQTHYWRIDEVNEVEDPATWEGDVWSFSSVLYIVIDDMESYKSEDGKWVWETWTDGFENSSNGALLGHSGDNMETETVHEGSQSLPYNYGQNGAAVSEATLPIDAQDWSKNEVRSLSLMFYGDSDNTPGQMYVGINGSRVADYPGTPDDMKQSLWHAWQIDLQSLGITTVNSLTLGVQGGTGTIYVDDIRLYPLVPEYVTPVAPDNASLVAYYALDGAATDASGNGAHGVENGFPTYEAGVEGQAIRLDGIDDFVDLGIPEHWPSGAAPRTLCAWAQTFSVEPGWRVIAGYGSPATGQGTGLVMNGTSLYGSGYGSDVSIDNFWAVEEWHHVGLTYDGTTVRLYADGVEVVSGEVDWNTVITVARIGRQVNELQEFWDGRVDEVRLYDQALSLAEMAWLAGRTAPVAKPF